MDRLTAFGLFESARVARLATVSPSGEPHLVPIVFAFDGPELVSSIDEKPKHSHALRRLENIRVNPNVTVLADHYDDDWSRLWWVRIDGTARVVESGEPRATALASLIAKYPQYGDEPPTGPVIRVAVGRVSGWSGAPQPSGRPEYR